MNIFIFHRDFRIEDNIGLYQLALEEKEIYLVFIITKDQTKNNAYFSANSFQALIFCLKQLATKCHINILKANNEKEAILNLLKTNHKINKIYTNRDFTPYALNRGLELYRLSKEYNFIYKEFYDYTLIDVNNFNKTNGLFYEVFTPFWNKMVKTYQDKIIRTHDNITFKAMKLDANLLYDISNLSDNDFGLPLTREEVKNAIFNLSHNYKANRDMLDYESGTSQISAALKFGVISIRQAYNWATEKFHYFENPFSRQLAWRDFYYQIAYNAQLSKRWVFGQNWNQRMNSIQWSNNQEHLEHWKNGTTGFEIVDAGMRQLNKTGKLHNRARLICASFLVKNLLINWKEGEKYFAQKLIDYDPIINQCSWQWVAGTGFDAQPFFRIFNPYLQQQKFDPHKNYINKYLDENYNCQPIIDYKESVKQALIAYDKTK